jgi:hypothetical protein
MSEFGYDKDRVDTIYALYTAAHTAHLQQNTEYAEQFAATAKAAEDTRAYQANRLAQTLKVFPARKSSLNRSTFRRATWPKRENL